MPTPPPSYSFSTEATEYGVRKSYYLTSQEGSAEVENLHVKGTLEVDGTTTLASTLTVSAPANINGLITTNGGVSCTSGSSITAAGGTVTASTLVGGSGSIAGGFTVNATNAATAGLQVGGVAGSVNMNVPVSTLQNFQVVSAASLTTAGAITCAGPLTVINTGTTSPQFTNSTASVISDVVNVTSVNVAPGYNYNSSIPSITASAVAALSNYKTLALKIKSLRLNFGGGTSAFLDLIIAGVKTASIQGQVDSLALYRTTSQSQSDVTYVGGASGAIDDFYIMLPFNHANWPSTGINFWTSNSNGSISAFATLNIDVVGIL